MRCVQDTAAASKPFTVEEVKTHLRVTSSTEDAYIDSLIDAATSLIESDLNRSLITQTWIQYLDAFPGGTYRAGRMAIYRGDPYQETAIRLLKGPVQSVEAVKYLDSDGVEQTLTVNTDYIVDLTQPVPRIVPAPTASWPATQDVPNAVYVEFTAGYGDASEAIPGEIRQAGLMITTGWYNARGAVAVTEYHELPGAYIADRLLSRHRLMRFE